VAADYPVLGKPLQIGQRRVGPGKVGIRGDDWRKPACFGGNVN
jgi:hypothetical protein